MVEVKLSRKNTLTFLVLSAIGTVVFAICLIFLFSYSPYTDLNNSTPIQGTIKETDNSSDSFDIILEEYDNRTFRVTNLFSDVFSFTDAAAELTAGKLVYLNVIKTHFESDKSTVNIRALRTDEKVYLDEETYHRVNVENIVLGKTIVGICLLLSTSGLILTLILNKKRQKTLMVEPQDLLTNYLRPDEDFKAYRKRAINKKYVALVLSLIGIITLSLVAFILDVALFQTIYLLVVSIISIILSVIYYFINAMKIRQEDIEKYTKLYQFTAQDTFDPKMGSEEGYILFTEDAIVEHHLELPPNSDPNIPLPKEKLVKVEKVYPYHELEFTLRTKYQRIHEILIVFIHITSTVHEEVNALFFLDENLYSIIKKYNINVPNLDGYLKNIKTNIETNIKRVHLLSIKEAPYLQLTYVKNKEEKFD